MSRKQNNIPPGMMMVSSVEYNHFVSENAMLKTKIACLKHYENMISKLKAQGRLNGDEIRELEVVSIANNYADPRGCFSNHPDFQRNSRPQYPVIIGGGVPFAGGIAFGPGIGLPF